MVKDFREYLEEASRHDVFGRVFKEVAVGRVMVSFQASATHACQPEETLDDVYAYTNWEVSLRSVKPHIDVMGAGAWCHLNKMYWAKGFEAPEFQRAVTRDNMPVEECQQLLQDVFEFAKLKEQIKSEDEIRVLEADEEIKKTIALKGGPGYSGGCSGCGGK